MAQNTIARKIVVVRGQRVMLASDLAILYEVTTGNLNLAVRRNALRFPPDFMFQLTKAEHASLRLQLASLELGRGRHPKYLPYAFTEAEYSHLEASGLRVGPTVRFADTRCKVCAAGAAGTALGEWRYGCRPGDSGCKEADPSRTIGSGGRSRPMRARAWPTVTANDRRLGAARAANCGGVRSSTT
ncbi:MAG TPA: ORF6N domain-containing protein [Gammaproteobacteria bacterium]|nr:ORF6N domain-containing protein [Gammaproteobacteria bacterium]